MLCGLGSPEEETETAMAGEADTDDFDIAKASSSIC
jgi:hypothetical protein